jgi:hypothetical protein
LPIGGLSLMVLDCAAHGRPVKGVNRLTRIKKAGNLAVIGKAIFMIDESLELLEGNAPNCIAPGSKLNAPPMVH